MMRLSERTEAEWKKFLTFADWSRASVFDLSQFAKVVASAMANGDEDIVTFLFERDLDESQVKSELFGEIGNASDWIREGILHYQELRAGT
jgi:hypothetical protein